MKKEVQKWQNSPDMMTSPLMTPKPDVEDKLGALMENDEDRSHNRSRSVDKIPLLSEQIGGATGIDGGAKDVARERKIGDLPA